MNAVSFGVDRDWRTAPRRRAKRACAGHLTIRSLRFHPPAIRIPSCLPSKARVRPVRSVGKSGRQEIRFWQVEMDRSAVRRWHRAPSDDLRPGERGLSLSPPGRVGTTVFASARGRSLANAWHWRLSKHRGRSLHPKYPLRTAKTLADRMRLLRRRSVISVSFVLA